MSICRILLSSRSDLESLSQFAPFVGTRYRGDLGNTPAFGAGNSRIQYKISIQAGNQNTSLGRIICKLLLIPAMVGDGARCQVAEGEERECNTRQ